VSLSSLPTALLIPPINLVPLGLAGLAVMPRWPRLGRATALAALLALLVLALPVTSTLLLRSLEAGIPRDLPPNTRNIGAIVVLSADPAFGDQGGLLPGSGIGAMTLDRMRGGATLQHQTGLGLLVSGGPLEPGAMPIAIQMAQSLAEDFATRASWIEPASTDTWENAEFSAAILKPAGITAVYVVTHAWHMRRALMAFRHAGLAATPPPLRFTRPPRYVADDFIPQVSSWVRSYYALHEWLGCLYYAIRP